jgi:cytoskeletal protein CcmA (bactofilin family)
MLKKMQASRAEVSVPNQMNEGTRIEGNIHCEGNIRIDGTVVGEVHAGGKVVVGPKGMVEGHVFCNQADVMGKIVGNVTVKEQTLIKATGIVEGDLTTTSLGMEEGATLNGRCQMSGPEAPRHA